MPSYFYSKDEKQTLTEEKSALQMRVGFLEKDLRELKEQEKSLLNQTVSCGWGKGGKHFSW